MSGHPLYSVKKIKKKFKLYCAILANHCAKLVTNFEYYGFVTNFAQWLAKKQKETADTVPCIYSIILKNKTINFLYNRRWSRWI